MKLVVFGATGNTGRNVVEQALEAGHEVTAVARKPPALKISHARLEVLRGDVMDPDSVWSGGRKRRGDLGARNQLQPWAHHRPLGGGLQHTSGHGIGRGGAIHRGFRERICGRSR